MSMRMDMMYILIFSDLVPTAFITIQSVNTAVVLKDEK